MLKFRRAVLMVTLGLFLPALGPAAGAETLRFAWPDGASAKVQVRYEGRRVEGGAERAWNMSCDFTMQVRRDGDRVVVARNDFTGWKGTLPPSFGGGLERYEDMIPILIVSGDGSLIGIEGQATARRLITQSVEQSGGLEPVARKLFEGFLSDASLKSMADSDWSTLAALWRDTELDPDAVYEIGGAVPVPALGGEVDIKGTVRFVKEAPCASGQGDRRCVHLHAETGADKAQVSKLIESALRQAGANGPAVSTWDQNTKVDIVVDKATMLPQQLTITAANGITLNVQGQRNSGSEERTKSYSFAWTLPDGGRKQ